MVTFVKRLIRCLFITAVLSTAAGFPTSSNISDDSLVTGEGQFFSVQQVSGGKVPLHGASEVVRAYRKYKIEVPAHIAKSHKTATTVGLNPETFYGNEYLTPVDIEGQILNMEFDTSMADLWVFSSDLPPDQSLRHQVWNPSGCDGNIFEFDHGAGNKVAGSLCWAAVKIGGMRGGVTVETAYYVSQGYIDDIQMSGSVGFGFSHLPSGQDYEPNYAWGWFNQIKGKLKKKLFAVSLKQTQPGTFDFGWIDESKHVGPLVYHKFDKNLNYWSLVITAYTVGDPNVDVTLYHFGSIKAVLDTASALMYMPAGLVADYWSQVSGATGSSSEAIQAGGIIFPCSEAPSLPDLTFYVDNVPHVVPGHFLYYAPYNENWCFGGLQTMTHNTEFAILGNIFMHAHYVVFDTKGPKIGLAPQPKYWTDNDFPGMVIPEHTSVPPASSVSISQATTITAASLTSSTSTSTTAESSTISQTPTSIVSTSTMPPPDVPEPAATGATAATPAPAPGFTLSLKLIGTTIADGPATVTMTETVAVQSTPTPSSAH